MATDLMIRNSRLPGLLEHRVTVLGAEDDGAQWLASQVVTPKVLTVLAQKLGRAV